MDLDFGISLDPSAVTQRHTLYDSDEEETEIENIDEIFSVADSDSQKPGCTLILTVGQTASIFARSYFELETDPVCKVTSKTPTVIKDKYFPSSSDQSTTTISEVYEAKTASGCTDEYLVCVHERELKSEYLNIWCSKVINM